MPPRAHNFEMFGYRDRRGRWCARVEWTGVDGRRQRVLRGGLAGILELILRFLREGDSDA